MKYVAKKLADLIAQTKRLRRRRNSSRSQVESLEQRQLLTINIQFDYSYDESGFFNPQDRRDLLEAAADVFEARITDDLDAITPGGGNNWTAIFPNPETGGQVTESNLTIPADTILVYVGARDLTSGLGLAGPGGLNVSGTGAFVQGVQTRGEAGVDTSGSNDTDFGLWGGTITFDSEVQWHFGLEEPVSGRNDFYSVAIHELGHVLGFGTAESFINQINGANRFTGPASVEVFGGTVPMLVSNGQLDPGHWANDTESTLPGTTTVQETAMDPNLTTGTRKLFTNLDWAGLEDLGWDIAPVAAPRDFGDAPDSSSGTGVGNYQTRSADNGPSHQVNPNLFIGSSVDADSGTAQNSTATSDDITGDDDEGFRLSTALFAVEGESTVIEVNVTNNIGSAATLYGWIDLDADGNFEANERASVSVPSGTDNGVVSLNFPASAIGSAGSTFARFRLSTDSAAASSTGAAANGEVEDHSLTILTREAAFDPLPLFTWPATTGATHYELEVTDLETDTVILQQVRLSQTQFRPTEAFAAGRYSWRFRPFTSAGAQAWSPDQTLAVFETSDTPFITDPVTSSVDSLPTFAWSPVQNATRYELWVNGSEKSHIINQTLLTVPSFTVVEGLPADTYTAWVRAFNGSTELAGGWSPAYSFTLATSGQSVLTDPVGGSTTTAPTFGWLPMNVPSYTLEIEDVNTGATVLEVSRLSGTSYTPDSALPIGEYRAYITGQGQARSVGVDFQIYAATGQVQFDMVSLVSENPLPVFRWHDVATANRYEIWVEDRATRELVLHSSQLTTTAIQPDQPLPTGNYRAWVRAFSGSEAVGTWSSAIDYTVRESVAVPTVWAPVNAVQSSVPTFVWSSVFGATHYELDISTAAVAFEQQTQIAGNSLQLESPLAPGTYQTNVRAFDGQTLLGTAERQFTVQSTDGFIAIESPGKTTTNTRPVIAWNTVENASRYFLWINDDSRGTVGVVLENNLLEPSFQPEFTLAPGRYRAWVRAFDGSTPVSDWSAALSFEVRQTESPLITSPQPNSSNPVPRITWTSVAGAVTYDIEIDDVTNGVNNIVTQQSIADTSFQPTTPLPVGEYRVRVRWVDTAGTSSAFSESKSFSIDYDTSAELVRPTMRSTTEAAVADFVWTNVNNTARYELWVNNLTTGEARFIDETTLTSNRFVPSTQLPAGQYRAWVRAISNDGTEGPWSSGVEFTIVASASIRSSDLEEREAAHDSTLLTSVDRFFERQAKPTGNDWLMEVERLNHDVDSNAVASGDESQVAASQNVTAQIRQSAGSSYPNAEHVSAPG